MIAKSYGYVYVAQVAMGASQAQYFNVIKEAEAYHGPSLSPRLNPKSGDFSGLGSQVHWTCSYATPLQSAEGREHRINQSNEVSNHGIKIGMGRTQNEEKKAVECGYWQNGFHLDSKEPDWSKFRDFIMGEVRYNSLMKTFPQEAEELFVATERNAKLRYEGYKKLSEM